MWDELMMFGSGVVEDRAKSRCHLDHVTFDHHPALDQKAPKYRKSWFAKSSFGMLHWF